MHKVHGGMGFKDLSAFNLAMLGKQGWNFLTEPESLVTRIFKARYFPSHTYLTTQLGHNPSYVWRSIMRARFIVRGGARWSIGSDSSISILNDPWLSNGECIDGSIVGAHFVQNVTINNLMNLYNKSRKEEVVRQIFSVDIAAKILNTPLIAQVQDDCLIWKAEKNGCYSVRSAYRLCVNELIDSSHLHRPGSWSGIWKLKVPPKVKNLVWRMCRGCLPTRVRLLDKGVQCSTHCVSCNSNHEDLAHLIFYCPFTVQVWHMTGIWGAIQHAIQSTASAVETIFLLLDTLSAEQNQQLAATLWSLWKHRNLKVWDDATEVSATVVERAKNLVDNWHIANTSSIASLATQQQAQQPHGGEHSAVTLDSSTTPAVWQRPLSGRYKCNIDTAFSSSLNRTGMELTFVFGILTVHLSWQKLSVFHVFTRLMLAKH